MSNLFRSPLLHFLLIGALLFVAQGWTSSRETVDDPDAFRIAIEADRLAELKTTFTRQMRRRPEPAEVDRMIEAEVEEEILYREAISRGLLERDGGVQTRLIQKMLFLEGSSQIEEAPALLARAIELRLHEDDIVVRRILVQKMKLLGSTLEASQIPSAADVAAAYQEEREELRARFRARRKRCSAMPYTTRCSRAAATAECSTFAIPATCWRTAASASPANVSGQRGRSTRPTRNGSSS